MKGIKKEIAELNQASKSLARKTLKMTYKMMLSNLVKKASKSIIKLTISEIIEKATKADKVNSMDKEEDITSLIDQEVKDIKKDKATIIIMTTNQETMKIKIGLREHGREMIREDKEAIELKEEDIKEIAALIDIIIKTMMEKNKPMEIDQADIIINKPAIQVKEEADIKMIEISINLTIVIIVIVIMTVAKDMVNAISSRDRENIKEISLKEEIILKMTLNLTQELKDFPNPLIPMRKKEVILL